MRTLSINEARAVLAQYPFLRLHMIPAEGLLLEAAGIWIVCNSEGEVRLVKIDE